VTRFPRVASLGGAEGLRARLRELEVELPVDDEALAAPASPLAQPLELSAQGRRLAPGNRFAVQPMEGWDGERDGRPSPLTERRWRRFGASGAAWVWGGEAAAVRADGRANPHQLVVCDATAKSLGGLRRALLAAAREAGHPEPVVGLQLTHSGRWSRPDGSPRPRTAFAHPLLDPRVGAGPEAALSDAEVEDLVGCFARAAALAASEGFDFVDLKHCHGYLLHEFLAARPRPGRFGGPSLPERLRLLDALLDAVRAAAPGLPLAVRLSVFDRLPHRPRADSDDARRLGPGEPEPHPRPYSFAFGLDADDPARSDWSEPLEVARHLVRRGVRWLNATAGSPYTVPHVQRPAAFPPSDGYAPPEDPLVGVARLFDAARRVKRAAPEAVVVASGASYLQELLPHVAQACVRAGWFDAVGLGRMMLSCPELPAEVLAGRAPARKRICRTFSDCTTAPRNGLVSGCYPLDPFYRERPERARLETAKRGEAAP